MVENSDAITVANSVFSTRPDLFWIMSTSPAVGQPPEFTIETAAMSSDYIGPNLVAP